MPRKDVNNERGTEKGSGSAGQAVGTADIVVPTPSQGGSARPVEELQFITITDPSQSSNSRNRRIVRSQAMRHARKVVRPSAQKRQVQGKSGERSGRESSPASSSATSTSTFSSNSASTSTSDSSLGSPTDISSHEDSADSSGEKEAVDRRQKVIIRLNKRSSSPVSILGAGRVDPFKIFPVAMKPYMNFLIDYYVQVSGQQQMPLAGVRSPLITNLVPLARSNEAFLHCLLCLAASQYTLANGITKPRAWEIYHRGEAFKLLMQALSDPKRATSDEIVASILVLGAHDVHFGQHEAHEAHMQGLDRIIAVRGGVDKLGFDGLLRMQITWANHFRMKRRQAQSLLTDSPIPDPQPTPSMIDSLAPPVPRGFRDLALRGLVGSMIVKAVSTLTFLIARANDPSEPTVSAAVEFSDRRAEIESNMEIVKMKASLKADRYIEGCCALAILHYILTALRRMPPSTAPHGDISRQLLAAIEKTNLASYWQGEFRVLLWVLFIGYASSHELSRRVWYVGLIKRIISRTKPRLDPNGMKKVLSEFLYSEFLYHKSYEDMWVMMMKDP